MKFWSILFALCQVNNLTLNPWYCYVLGLFSLFCLFLFCTNFEALPVIILVNVIYLTDASIIWQQGLRFVHLLFTICSQESFRLNFVHVLFTFCSFYVLKNPRQYFDRGLVVVYEWCSLNASANAPPTSCSDRIEANSSKIFHWFFSNLHR